MPPPYPLLPALYQKPWGEPKPDWEPHAGEKTGDAPSPPPSFMHWGHAGAASSTPKPRLPPEASRGGVGGSPRPSTARFWPGKGGAPPSRPHPPQQISSSSPVIPGGLGPPRGGRALPGRAPACTGDGGEGGARRTAPTGPTRGPGGAKAPRGDDPPLPWRLWAALPPSPVQPGPPGGAKPARPGAPARRGLPCHRHRGPGAPGPAVPTLRRRRGGPGPTGSPGGGHHRYRCR